MSTFKRRRFIQLAGATLAATGINPLRIQHQADRYAQVLAQSTPRKLALLVGVNTYPKSTRFLNLKGSTTDALCQQQLLIHRFGFHPNDIQVLTNDDSQRLPTRANILTAFEEHLIKQAKPGDIVVFHFSGHGSRINDPIPRNNPTGKPLPLNSTFVPTDEQAGGNSVDDIMGKTFFMLVSALPTEHVTVILDTCYSGGGTRGNVRYRSAEGGAGLRPSDKELNYQEYWLRKLNLTPEDLVEQRDIGVAKGIVIASAQADEKAMDATINDFDAGIFTYLMTQYLWQQTESVHGTTARVTRELKRKNITQTPFPDLQVGRDFDQQSLFFLSPTRQSIADAIITRIEGNQAEIWLGGIPAEHLVTFASGSTFQVSHSDSSTPEIVTLKKRKGLVGTVDLPKSISKGARFLQENRRRLPHNLKLRLGLDSSLSESEGTAAKKSIEQLGRFEALLPDSTAGGYSAEVQYILARANQLNLQGISFQNQSSPASNSLGLFYPSLDAIIPDSFGSSNESAVAAVIRLQAKLRSLLAARLVRLTLNAQSSKLAIRAWINQLDDNQTLVGTAFTARNATAGELSPTSKSYIPYRSLFQVNILNQESVELYLSVLVIDQFGNIIVLFPNQWQAAEEETRVQPNTTIRIGEPGGGFKIRALTRGFEEVLVIACRRPLTNALLALRELASKQLKPAQRGPITPTLESIDQLLTDLSRGESHNDKIFDTDELATLSISFEVI